MLYSSTSPDQFTKYLWYTDAHRILRKLRGYRTNPRVTGRLPGGGDVLLPLEEWNRSPSYTHKGRSLLTEDKTWAGTQNPEREICIIRVQHRKPKVAVGRAREQAEMSRRPCTPHWGEIRGSPRAHEVGAPGCLLRAPVGFGNSSSWSPDFDSLLRGLLPSLLQAALTATTETITHNHSSKHVSPLSNTFKFSPCSTFFKMLLACCLVLPFHSPILCWEMDFKVQFSCRMSFRKAFPLLRNKPWLV